MLLRAPLHEQLCKLGAFVHELTWHHLHDLSRTVTAGKAFWSKDLLEWTQLDPPASTTIFCAETIGSKAYLLGAQGRLIQGEKGLPWTALVRELGANPFRGVTYGQGRFVAVGHAGQIAYSDDGVNWITPSQPPKSKYLNSVSHGRGQFIAVGAANSIEVSTNGESWEKVYGADIGPTLYNVVWDGTAFLVAGDQGVFVSFEGREWQRQLENLPCYCVTAGKGVRVASRGIWLTVATNGSDWQVVTNSERSIMWDGAFGNDRFVLVGDRGDAWISTNGFDWITSKVRESWALNEVEFAGDRFIAAGVGGYVFSSVDGLAWQQHLVESPSQIFGLGYGHDKLVVAGAGTLLLSDPIHSAVRFLRNSEIINGKLRLSFLAHSGLVGLERSFDLSNWDNLGFLFAPMGRGAFELEMSQNYEFYRAVPLPLPQSFEPASGLPNNETLVNRNPRCVLGSLGRFTDWHGQMIYPRLKQKHSG